MKYWLRTAVMIVLAALAGSVALAQAPGYGYIEVEYQGTTGWVEEEVLNEHYRRASVYVQPSAHEGFGLSVAEGMLAGCIPVTTRAGALPEVVGDVGVQIDGQDPAHLADAIARALEAGPEARAAARKRVLDHFPLEVRREGVQRLVAETLAAHG